MHIICTVQGTKLCVTEISKGDDEENEAETIFEELMKGNILKIMKIVPKKFKHLSKYQIR